MDMKHLNKLKAEAKQTVLKIKEEKEKKKYNPELMKRRWLREFQDKYSRSFRQAEILKEKYYKKDGHITPKVIYGRIWQWSKENSIRDNEPIKKWKAPETDLKAAAQ